MTSIIDKIKMTVLRSNAKDNLIEGIKKGYEFGLNNGRAEREKEILEIIDKWDNGDDNDAEELKSKIKEMRGKK